MARSEPVNHVRDAIIEFLGARNAARIVNIRLSLQKRFPDTYRKGGNLTMIHRHLNNLKDNGYVIAQEVNGETWYILTPKWITEKIEEKQIALEDIRIQKRHLGLQDRIMRGL